MAGAKERPFKTAPYPSAYLVGDIHRFYNGPSPQYEIKGESIINDYGSVKQRGYFNSDIINICPCGNHGLYETLYSVPRIPEGDY